MARARVARGEGPARSALIPGDGREIAVCGLTGSFRPLKADHHPEAPDCAIKVELARNHPGRG